MKGLEKILPIAGKDTKSLEKNLMTYFNLGNYSSPATCHDTELGTNVVVQWLNLLLYIREVPGSNLDPEIGYPDRGVS
jgi:hypothetical protein